MEQHARLFLPPAALAGCLLVGVYRNTRGAALSAPDRTNYFPASPMATVTLIRHGCLHILPPGADWTAARHCPTMPRLSALSPQETPVTSWSPGDVEALTLGIYPDAWRLLGGDLTCADVPQQLTQALANFDAATDADTGWIAFCDALTPHWTHARPAPWHRATSVTDWVKGITTRAALTGSGRSLRSVERRMQRFTGQTRRTLEFFSAIETLQGVVHRSTGAPLAQIAHEAGYADQSHMGRAVRRATGFSPARLNRAIENEEPFWCYRLLGEMF